jgi:hypothetical protein
MPNPGDGALWPVFRMATNHLIRPALFGVCLILWHSGANAAARPGYVGGACGPDLLVTFDSDALCDAVVKVPPPVGCVKHKAQHIVLPMQILLFLACYKVPYTKLALNFCGFPQKTATNAGFTFTATSIPATGSQLARENRARNAQLRPFRTH